ncbi:hypothetical protein K2Z83_23820 [Oscillochloris sp. ZM17-4]|uniref:helicase-related protein n=1 Tax=Oscillochloris sp. ZM17-4 TaxID=2866714 RepID=UPI001C72C341|nr:helicase-related protein [Oscillochloris sp. ZM17-4]MBX0330689.1 hypothetical protein [Oscillochloris sp. ZM17-4]
MVQENNETNNDRIELLPYQRDFVLAVMRQPKPAHIILEYPLGLGKGAAIVELIRLLYLQSPGEFRCLIVTASPLRYQWADRIRHVGVSTTLIDNSEYRRRLATQPVEKSVWASFLGAVVVSVDFIKRPAIYQEIQNSYWSLIFFDDFDTHFSSSQRGEVLQFLWKTSNAGLKIATTIEPGQPHWAYGTPQVVQIRWTYKDLEDVGVNLHIPERTVYVLNYQLSPEEVKLHNLLYDYLNFLGQDSESTLIRSVLMRRWKSSPGSLDLSLQRRLLSLQDLLGSSPNKGVDLLSFEIEEEEEELESLIPEEVIAYQFQDELARIQDILAVLEDISVDSKLLTLNHLIDRFSAHTEGSTVIFTKFTETALYIKSALERDGKASLVITGSMSYEERIFSLEEYRNSAKILIATSAIADMRGHTSISHVIHYDFSTTTKAFQKRARFAERLSSTRRTVHHYFLVTDADSEQYELRRMIEKVVEIEQIFRENQ